MNAEPLNAAMTPAAHIGDTAADRQAGASNPPPRASSVLLWVVVIELVVLFAPTVRFLFERWTMSVWHNAHGLFVAPISAWLAWDELRRDAKTPVKGSAWGFAFVVPALSLQAIDAGLHTELLSAIALIMLIPGLALLVLGAQKTRLIAFPLFFLVFALPIPLGMTETLHLVLRHLTVAVTSLVLPIMGITVFVEDTTLHLTNGALTVADACSGFSTLYAALAVATFAAYTAHSAARRVVVLALAAPIAILSNIARILLLVVLVQGWGPDVLHTVLHPLSGLLTFAIALPLIFWIGGPVKSGEPSVRNTALAG